MTATVSAPRCSGRRTATRASRKATPGRLYLPPNQDAIYGYQAVNVEAQRDSSNSLLNWTKTMLGVRRRHDAFAIGMFRELGGSNPSVLAFVRETATDTVLCVNNLSRFPQPIELNLQQWNGFTPVEMTGYVDFEYRGAALLADPARPRVLLVPATRPDPEPEGVQP